ncbi:MAG: hypothetical protein NVSMB66_2480 [Candidatus Doudnabacteria bacterium]
MKFYIILATLIIQLLDLKFASAGLAVSITAIAALVAAIFAGYQAYLFRFSNSVNVYLGLEKRFFESEDMIEKRKSAALAIYCSERCGVNIKDYKDDIEEILDFFETIGILVKKDALDKDLVFNGFFYWVHGYWIHTEQFVKSEQKKFPTRYKYFIWLHELLIKEERRLKGLNPKEWSGFIQEELGRS